MQGPDYIFFIQDSQNRFWKRDDYGNVVLSTLPAPLQFSIDMWREVSIQLERNKRYWGMERSSTIPLRHVEDGAAILKHHYYTFGISADLFLSIAEQKLVIAGGLYSFEYDLLYNGKYDFSTFNHQGAVVTCNTVEGGLGMYIKTNENTVYSIPMDVAENVNVYHDGLNLKAANSWLTISQQQGTTSATTGVNNLLWLQTTPLQPEGTIFNTEQQGTSPLLVWSSNVAYNDARFADEYIFKATAPVTIIITATITVQMINGNYVKLYIKNSNGARIVLFQLNGNNSSSGETISQTYTINQSVTLATNESIYLISELSDSLAGSGGALAIYQEFTMYARYTSRYKPTICKSLPLMYVAKELVKKMSDGLFSSVSSTFIDSLKIQLTCGDALRQLPGAAIRISWSQLFNSINVSENIGAAPMNNVLVIERKEYWFETTKNIALGSAIGDPMYSPAVDYLFNTLKIGWPNQDYEALNGRDEFNTTSNWTLPVVGIAKELTLVSDVRADMYGIEITRINLDGKTTTDSSSDNDNFFLKVGEFSDGTYKLDRSLNATATGLIDAPSAYNIYFSPKRCLLRHGWFLRSCLDKLDNKWIKFQTLDKNRELACDGIDEDADILIADLPARKFIPVMAEMEVSSPEFPMDNGVRTYSFIDSFVPFSGIAMRTGIQPSTQKTQQFQLLLKPDADLTKLIDIYE